VRGEGNFKTQVQTANLRHATCCLDLRLGYPRRLPTSLADLSPGAFEAGTAQAEACATCQGSASCGRRKSRFLAPLGMTGGGRAGAGACKEGTTCRAPTREKDNTEAQSQQGCSEKRARRAVPLQGSKMGARKVGAMNCAPTRGWEKVWATNAGVASLVSGPRETSFC